jgi:hypothetical protein
MRSIIFILFAATVILSSCGQKNSVSANYELKTECMGVELDGSQTVKAWGNGRNRFDAVDQAKKNAINDVIFKGVREGKAQCETRPLVGEVNAREKHQQFFNAFFVDKGEYEKFISVKDERIGEKIVRDRSKGRESVTHGFIIRIDVPGLRSRLTEAGIIK